MSLILEDRVRETSTVTGTSDATLLGAVTGFQAFSVIGNGNTTYYTISDQSGNNWEVGIGTFSSIGPTLARTTVLSSSAGGAKVSFPAGTKDVFVTYPSDKAVYLDESGNVQPALGTVNATTVDTTNLEVTNIKAKDGTAAGSIANSTGVVTLASSVLTTTDINGGTIDGTTIGGSTAAAGNFTTLGASGVATFSAGTVSAPAITTTGDTNTGIFFPAADTIAFTEGGVESMRIDSSGNVGIGTSSPSYRLHVVNSGGLGLVAATSSDASGVTTYMQANGATAGIFGTLSNHPQTFVTNNTERMRIDSSGNLCLGQTTADGKMTSNAASDSQRSYHAGNTSSSVTTDGMYYAYCNTVSGTGYNFAGYQNASGVVFKVIGNGNVQNTNNSYGAISDAKLKNIIGAAPSYWDKFKQYQFVNYTLKADESEIKLLGLVAQQVEAISPSLIEETADRDAEGSDLGTTTKGIKYSVVTLQAEVVLQEAMARIEALEAKVDAQAARIAALESN